MRYHSLEVTELPDGLDRHRLGADGTVMGVRQRIVPAEGVQFHPESILSEHGEQLVRSFLEQPWW